MQKVLNKITDSSDRRLLICAGALATIFSLFIIFGESFDETQSTYLVFGSSVHIFLAIVQFLFWFVVFYLFISWLFQTLDSIVMKKRAKPNGKTAFDLHHPKISQAVNWYYSKCKRRPFVIPLITILIAFLPFWITSYPGVFMGDSNDIIPQAVGTLPLDSKHPLAYILLNRLFLSLHPYLGWNLSLFILTSIQALLFCVAIAYGLSTIIKKSSHKTTVYFLLIYYCLHPLIYQAITFLTKDIIYTSCCTLFITLLFRVFFDSVNEHRTQEMVWLGLATVGVALFRSEGIYVSTIVYLFMLFAKDLRRKSFLYLTVAIIAFAVQRIFLFPMLNVKTYSIAEMLSVPFQQTARYVRDYPNEVTLEEKEIISAVLDYDNLGVDYNYIYRSDMVKGKYHGNNETLKKYFIVWLKMFFKHPGVYFQATMDSYYQYFFVSPNSKIWGESRIQYSEETWLDITNSRGNTEFSHPTALAFIGRSYQKVRDKMNLFPIFDIFTQPALYTWTLLLMVMYCIYRKSYRGTALLMLGIVQMSFFVLGPTNGYYGRYELPMIVYLPIMSVLLLLFFKDNSCRCKHRH